MAERLNNPFKISELVDAVNSIESGTTYTAGDWISIDENNEISAKGDTNPFLGVSKQVEKTLYAWSSSDENFPVIYTEEIDELTSYPYYNSQHIPLDKTSVISVDELRYKYHFGTAEYSQNEINVEKITYNQNTHAETTITITYTQNSELNTTYTTTIFDSSDEVLPRQKAVFEFFNNNTIKYVNNTQSMKIGVK